MKQLKRTIRWTSLPYIALALIVFLGIRSKKDIPRFEEFEAYEFTGLDKNRGTWRPVLLKSPSEIELDAPATFGSDEYKNQVDEIIRKQKSMSSIDREDMVYLTDNSALRWNEIALELAAKYNLIPPPNEQGIYVLPNPMNPADPPKFPFAHLPYTSRMLAQLSVTQFDGLIAAWHYKGLFATRPHYELNKEIDFAYVKQDISPYPSEGAIVGLVSKIILSAMFPLEKDYLEGKYRDFIQSLYHSGLAIKQDVEAGEKIGN